MCIIPTTATILGMNIVVGLGNFGDEYVRTRHNAGFRAVELYGQTHGLSFSYDKKVAAEVAKNSSTVLIKPHTYMNDSGRAVRGYYEYYLGGFTAKNGTSLWVMHDDLDIPLGSYKIQLGTGPKVHNGLLSLYEHLGTRAFWHVRIGIENRGDARAQWPARDYVLGAFTHEEESALQPVFTEVCLRIAQ